MGSEPVPSAAVEAVLAAAGFAGARRAPLAQDASTRSYERLVAPDGRQAMLMLAPPGAEDPPCPPDAGLQARRALGWNAVSRLAASRVEAFVALARHLNGHGFSAPRVLACDAAHGLAVLEDLGPSVFAARIAAGDDDEVALYAAAGETLAAVQDAPAPERLPGPDGRDWPLLPFDALALSANADLFAEWAPHFAGAPAFDSGLWQAWGDLRDALVYRILGQPRAFTLRDYHSENLIWLPERSGVARVGLLDFQDAVMGFRAWDMAMLLHDARRDVSPAAQAAAKRAWLDRSGADAEALETELAVQGALNALRILGIFSRLIVRDGKTRYRAFVPREIGHLRRLLERPDLADLNRFVARSAPLDAMMRAAGR